MSINRGFDNGVDPRKFALVVIESLKTDRSIPTFVARELQEYTEVSRAHYTGGLNRIGDVNRTFGVLMRRFPFDAPRVIAAFCDADVRRSMR